MVSYQPEALAIYDWEVFGIYAGNCLTKWAQHDGTDIVLNIDDSPKAFIISDIEFFSENRCRCSLQFALQHPRLITIYMDHKNLTFSNFTTDRITCWQLIVEEYGPKIVYLPSKRNIIADTLSRLPKLEDPHDESTFLVEIFALDEQTDIFSIAFDVISKAQLADNKIQQRITNNDPDFETRIIQRAPLVYFKGKIAIPANLRSCILTWYHENLLHPGADHMFHTISQHFTWPSLRTSQKLCQTLQHLPTLQDTKKKVWTQTCSEQATNC
jgi:hypothetical protein